MDRHHVITVPAHVEEATRAGQAAAMRALDDGLTAREAEQMYAVAYGCTIEMLAGVSL